MRPEYRHVGKLPGSSFSAHYFEAEQFPAAWHYHPQYELAAVLSSTGIRYVGDRVAPFAAPDLVLVGANLPHCWRTTRTQTDPVRCVVVRWGDDLLAPAAPHRPEFAPLRALLAASGRGLHFAPEVARPLLPRLRELVEAPPFGRLLGLLDMLHELATAPHTPLASAGYAHRPNPRQDERVAALYDFVRRHYARPLTLDEPAALVSMSRTGFCRFFRRQFGCSFFAFLHRYRIQLACRLLIDSAEPVGNVGYRVGFASPSLFHRQFRRAMGRTPGAYRRAYRDIG